MANEDPLLNVAFAIAAGSDVDWAEAAKRSRDDRDRSIVESLRVLSQIAALARNPSSRPTAGPEPFPAAPANWGHLRVLHELGHGSFGSVYRAWDSTLEVEVALKLMRPAEWGDSRLSQAVAEARRLARVRHPNVVAVHGADFHDGRFGLWMELIAGCTLAQLLETHGTMSAHEAASIGMDLCRAVAAVHQAGLLHGDIKATNVMREDGGRVVLMDFGAGRRIPTEGNYASSLAGTPLYLPPEVLAGHPGSVASDIYSTGVLLYQLVSGKYPVNGRDRDDLMFAHQRDARVPLLDARPDLPKTFVDVVERALAKNPHDRYKTAGHLGAALGDVIGAKYGGEIPDGRRMGKPAIGTLGLVILMSGAGIGWLLVNDSTSETAGQNAALATPPVFATAREPRANPSETFEIAAAFYALKGGREVRLSAGSRLAPGDRLFLSIEASRPVFVYVVNQDDLGESYLLFPLPDLDMVNPIATGRTTRLPGGTQSADHYWQVTSQGGREHFLIYVAPERLTTFEQFLAALPRAEFGRTVQSVRLSESAMQTLRGVGGLSMTEKTNVTSVSLADLPMLSETHESASGVWARRITFENPLQ